MTAPSLLSRDLAAIVGQKHVREARAERVTYAMDGLPTHRRVPDLVVLPGTREELIAVVRLLAAHDVPFVPRGAGTGLSGGALAGDGSVLLVLTRLNRILHVDAANARAVVEPGVVNAKLSAAVRPHGLHYAPDPSSQSACSIGGNVAENAGGPHCLKYGMTTNHILAIEAVLTDGSVVRFGNAAGEPIGMDLLGAIVGSEGTFAIVTEITIRLLPKPQAVKTLIAAYHSVEECSQTVSEIIGAGIVPAALEFVDARTIHAVEASVFKAGYPLDARAALLIELDGFQDGIEEMSSTISDICRKNQAYEVRVAKNDQERAQLWLGRKGAFGAMGRI